MRLWSDMHVLKLPLFVTFAGIDVRATSFRVLDIAVIRVAS